MARIIRPNDDRARAAAVYNPERRHIALVTTIPADALDPILSSLQIANADVARRFPGEPAGRQPVHTVYGGAHLFSADAAQKLGAHALRTLRDYAPDADTLADVFGLERQLAQRVYPRLVDKLTREPVEDLRVDFEDGFGTRPDAEEDHHATRTADAVAAALDAGLLPPGIGIRIKALGEELKRRGLRTFDLFLTRLLERSGGRLPPGFVVTLPKISAPGHVRAMAAACDAFEHHARLPAGTLKLEVMIETTQSIFAADGTVALPRLIAEGGGRIVGAHFGTYDYTAACSITAAHQHMGHPSCDFAKHVMQAALAGTGVRSSDGATNVLPVPPHRAAAAGSLSPAQRDENTRAVHRAWRLHAADVRHSLETGFYQGWDLHPAQLPSRYATVFAFFLEGVEAASDRLRNFVLKAAQATIVGDVFDDAATGQGLLNYFLRATSCGALTEDEAVALSGLTPAELRSRSFVSILATRRR
jgi:citrate lyase beta subunit